MPFGLTDRETLLASGDKLPRVYVRPPNLRRCRTRRRPRGAFVPSAGESDGRTRRAVKTRRVKYNVAFNRRRGDRERDTRLSPCYSRRDAARDVADLNDFIKFLSRAARKPALPFSLSVRDRRKKHSSLEQRVKKLWRFLLAHPRRHPRKRELAVRSRARRPALKIFIRTRRSVARRNTRRREQEETGSSSPSSPSLFLPRCFRRAGANSYSRHGRASHDHTVWIRIRDASREVRDVVSPRNLAEDTKLFRRPLGSPRLPPPDT